MDPDQNKGKEVAPSHPSRPWPFDRGEASAWSLPLPPPQQLAVPPVKRLGPIPTVGVGIWGEALPVVRQLQTMEGLHLPGTQGDVGVGVGRVAAYPLLEAPAPPPLIPPPHQQFGSEEQPRYQWSEVYASGDHISSFDAGARSYEGNSYYQHPVSVFRPPMAHPSTSQQLYVMDRHNRIDARYWFHHPAPLTSFPSTCRS